MKLGSLLEALQPSGSAHVPLGQVSYMSITEVGADGDFVKAQPPGSGGPVTIRLFGRSVSLVTTVVGDIAVLAHLGGQWVLLDTIGLVTPEGEVPPRPPAPTVTAVGRVMTVEQPPGMLSWRVAYQLASRRLPNYTYSPWLTATTTTWSTHLPDPTALKWLVYVQTRGAGLRESEISPPTELTLVPVPVSFEVDPDAVAIEVTGPALPPTRAPGTGFTVDDDAVALESEGPALPPTRAPGTGFTVDDDAVALESEGPALPPTRAPGTGFTVDDDAVALESEGPALPPTRAPGTGFTVDDDAVAMEAI